MLIVTTGNRELEPIMRENIRRCEAFGYRTLVYDIGDLGWGEPFAVDPAEVRHPDLDSAFAISGTFKPAMLFCAAKRAEHGELVVWIDADAVVMRPLDLPALDFDVACTLREPESVGSTGHPYTDYLNAGVVFARNCAAGESFLFRWANLCEQLPSDQAALNEAVAPGWTKEQWRASYGQVHVPYSYYSKILILPASEWNFSDFNRTPPADARVLHFKAGWRKLMGENWRNYLGKAA